MPRLPSQSHRRESLTLFTGERTKEIVPTIRMEIPRAMKAIFNASAELVTLERRILIEKTKGKMIEMQVLWR